MVADNIKNIFDKIDKACSRCGRSSNEIKLIGVSKTVSTERIIEAYRAGLKVFGENKAQELKEKAEILSDYDDIEWHFIGHLQTNKVKYVIDKAEYIHSVDSLKLAEEIEKRAKKISKVQNVLLEIKTSDEVSKFGLTDIDEIYRVAEFCKNSANLKLIGLMTIAPFVDDENVVRNAFINLRNLKEKLISEGFEMTELSMGMTGDFEIAIEEGATMIRIGTAIFGARSN
ncbi:pyridoxal phosphate enzyme, YggS family [Melioribacter roseus P3M-2]|uniref:Pyridoxal phosphate homeostasis protein n=1 Tax=Melioribacter roseus (strain DSM 23840 / JCM 17771 / VKM B-2668 / P3M-2) TaxID=1191523 RepID=I7A294_MELRP|nr:YggS family pyridoxal phosphate-dependent enzyme [Melioribacter roseus]AFN75338.1 pyridoxal phosphate enzyme, YggS family [Melioribacter roseus P3M-2]